MRGTMKVMAVVVFAMLMVWLFSAMISGCGGPVTVSVLTEATALERERDYRRERMREQQLEHGAGGCTPNFATGGCL